MKKMIDIHYHKFPIYAQFLLFKKLIGYSYMKCGIDSSNGYDRYPDGLPKLNVGITVFGLGNFGDCPKDENNISLNKDGQGGISL